MRYNSTEGWTGNDLEMLEGHISSFKQLMNEAFEDTANFEISPFPPSCYRTEEILKQ